jgi:hypothetical protein
LCYTLTCSKNFNLFSIEMAAWQWNTPNITFP